MKQHTKTYGLMTAVAMIVGIVIGSGIYFRADDILTYTGGDLGLGLLVLIIGASCIIFGSLSLSELSQRTDASGGVSSYYEAFISPRIAAAIGFFQTFVYFPSITAIVSWVAAIYTFLALGVNADFRAQIWLAAGFIVLFTALNLLSRKLAGHFQSLSTIVKMIPLILVALAGIFWTQPQPGIPAEFAVQPVRAVGWGWITALLPLAFSYDGWTIVVSIAPELRDAKRNLPRALILGPIVILLTYLLFFYGLTRLLGASFIMSTGDSAIQYAMNTLLGERLGNLLLVIIIISVLGVTNGILLGGMRLPQALAERGWIRSQRLARIHPTYQVSIASSLLYAGISLSWLVAHYFIQSHNLLQGRDISEISIVFNYLCLILLYIAVFQLFRKRVVQNTLTGFVAPILASIGSLLLLVGSLIASPYYVLIFLVFCLSSCLIGYVLYQE